VQKEPKTRNNTEGTTTVRKCDIKDVNGDLSYTWAFPWPGPTRPGPRRCPGIAEIAIYIPLGLKISDPYLTKSLILDKGNTSNGSKVAEVTLPKMNATTH
jgi:hypothetical protein